MSHSGAASLHHHIRRMTGRDPHEAHRVATPLELLFDLTFATSFGLAAAQTAHVLAAGHIGPAVVGFGFASFAICWAWINFSWFSSAYDTDDWVFRIATMVQMTGVLVLAIGLPRLFTSIEHGVHLDNEVIVLGYVIMRVPMLFQWLRAARQDPKRRHACYTYAWALSIAQVGWIALIVFDVSVGTAAFFTFVLWLVELAGPVIAERRDGGTPWHPHHIADRYSCFALIAMGEGVVGTVATLSAVTAEQGWTLDAALVCIAGTGLTFGIWWIYYLLPSAQILHAHRERSFVWGYTLIITIAAIVAMGAGLHVAAYYLEHEARIDARATVLSVAVPVGVFLLSVYGLYYYMLRQFDVLHIWLASGSAGVVALAIVAALSNVDMAVCLIVLMFAPMVTVIGYEVAGHRHQADALMKQGALE